MLNEVFKYKILSYKPMQKWHVSCAVLEKKNFYLGAHGSFDSDFTKRTSFLFFLVYFEEIFKKKPC
jgi:hypothetical protein